MPKKLTEEEREQSIIRRKEKSKERLKKWRAENIEKVNEASLKRYYEKNANKDIEYYINKYERVLKIIGGSV